MILWQVVTHHRSHEILRVEPGYERVDIGPTTNFVGNHMTQGAIDLVQAELGGCSDPTRLLQGNREAAEVPKLLEKCACRAEVSIRRTVDKYLWVDKPGFVLVEIPLSTGNPSVECSFSNHGFCVRLIEEASEPCTVSELTLSKLPGPIVPEKSSFSVAKNKVKVKLMKAHAGGPWDSLHSASRERGSQEMIASITQPTAPTSAVRQHALPESARKTEETEQTNTSHMTDEDPETEPSQRRLGDGADASTQHKCHPADYDLMKSVTLLQHRAQG